MIIFKLFTAISILFLTTLCVANDSTSSLYSTIQSIATKEDANALSVAYIENGELQLLTGFGQNKNQQVIDEHSLFSIGSVSKMLVGLSILKLQEEGKISLNDKLSTLAPEIAFTNAWHESNPILVAHLLEHTTGWPDMSMAALSFKPTQTRSLFDELAMYPQQRHSRWVPGTRHAYSNIGPVVAAYLIEKITGLSYEEYVQANFFNPLNMQSASFNKPESHQVYANPVNGDTLDYQPMLYRPSGALVASADDMSKLLMMFINRGKVNQQPLINDQSMDRMEISKTTLGYEKGVKAGYGITNYSMGYEGFNTPMYGHEGAIIGSFTQLVYVPKLNSGFIVMATGGFSSIADVSEALKSYMFRNSTQLDTSKNQTPLPDIYKHHSGYYRPLNTRSDLFSFNESLFGVMTIKTDEHALHRMPMLKLGWKSPSNEVSIGNDALLNSWSGLETIAIVQDPLAGEVIQAGSDMYVPISAFRAWGSLILIGLMLLLSLFALLYLPFWTLRYLIKRHLRKPQMIRRFNVSLLSVLLFAFLGVMSITFSDYTLTGTVNVYSLFTAILGLAYFLSAFYCMASAYLIHKQKTFTFKSTFYLIVVTFHLIFALFLASYELIWLQTWLH